MSNHFNFARRPFVNERLPRLVFVVAATLVIGLTLVHGFFLARYLVREQEELDVQVAELRDELAGTNARIASAAARIASAAASVAQGQTALSNDKTLFLAHLYRLKSFSWTGLFNELEGSSFFATVFPLDDVDLADLDAGAGSGIAATLQLRYVDFEPRTPEPEPKSEPEPDLDNATTDDDAAPAELDVIEDDPRPKAEREP